MLLALTAALQMHISRKVCCTGKSCPANACLRMQVCKVCVPSASAAASLLADALPPAEWAVFRHVIGASFAGMRAPGKLLHQAILILLLFLLPSKAWAKIWSSYMQPSMKNITSLSAAVGSRHYTLPFFPSVSLFLPIYSLEGVCD